MTTMKALGEPRGGRISISVSSAYPPVGVELASPSGFWVISVRDEGVGIAEGDLSKVFDPFYTTKAKGTSHGLGLPTVYAIAEGHGGYAEVQSKLGEGSDFRVYLPVVEAEPRSPSSTEAD